MCVLPISLAVVMLQQLLLSLVMKGMHCCCGRNYFLAKSKSHRRNHCTITAANKSAHGNNSNTNIRNKHIAADVANAIAAAAASDATSSACTVIVVVCVVC